MYLDTLDVYILRELLGDTLQQRLQNDPRIALSQVARRLGTTEDTVRNRLMGMRRGGALRGIRMGVNPVLLGCQAWFVFFEASTEERKNDVLRTVRDLPGVLWIISYLGTSAGFLFIGRGPRTLSEALSSLPSPSPGRSPVIVEHSTPPSSRPLTGTDRRILAPLCHDPRLAFDRVAQETKVSERTVRRRWERLVRDEALFVFPDMDLSKAEGIVMVSLAIFFTNRRAKERFEADLLPLVSSRFLMVPSREPAYAAYILALPNLSQVAELNSMAQDHPGVLRTSLRLITDVENRIPSAMRTMLQCPIGP